MTGSTEVRMNLTLLEDWGWKFENVDDSEGILQDIRRFIPELQRWPTASLEVSKRTLPFYRDYELVRIADYESSDRVLWGLYAPGDYWPLDDGFHTIRRVNRLEPLQPLSPETVTDYLLLLRAILSVDNKLPEMRQGGGGILIRTADGSQLKIERNGDLPAWSRNPARRRVRASPGVRKWTLLDDTSEEKKNVLDALRWTLNERSDEPGPLVRRADVHFYKKHRLYELLLNSANAFAFHQYYFLHNPERPIVRELNGKSQPIHETNEVEPPALASEGDASDYLRFFCWAIRAAEGPFVVVERFREIPWRQAPPEDQRRRILDNLKPISVGHSPAEGERQSSWEFAAAISYGRGFYRAELSLKANGLVEMTEDQLIEKELPVEDFPPGMLPFGGSMSREPVIYLDEHIIPPVMPGGLVSECSPNELIKRMEEDAKP
jgi:hypothetical protein